MSKNKLVERQKSKVKSQEKPKRFNKSKLKWRFYTGEIRNRYVDPKEFKRLHAPLDNILTYESEYQGYCVTLRPCAEGVNKDGEVVAYLYCTENNNRFFDQDKDGFWNEQKPSYRPDRPSKNCGGHANYMDMSNFGHISCHLLIAHAWVESRYNYMTEVWDEKTGKTVLRCTMQIDHKDTNTLNNNAENLEYVTPAENMRRKRITDRLKNKHGIDPRRLTPLLMHGIFSLPDGCLDLFIGNFKFFSKKYELPMTIENIRLVAAEALDTLVKAINDTINSADKRLQPKI